MLLLLALSLVAIPVAARASTAGCTNLPDGTPCNTACRSGGTCKNQICEGGHDEPDGTPCATENRCTVDDACQAGSCVEGPPVDCRPTQCQTATCEPQVGCSYSSICDLAIFQEVFNGAHDGGVPADLGDEEQVARPTRKVVPIGTVDGGSDGDTVGLDDPPSETRWHVHGSGCSVVDLGGRGSSSPSRATLLSLLLLLCVATIRRGLRRGQ